MSRPRWVVTVDGDRALVRGHDTGRVLRLLGAEPRWSAAGRGWVVPASIVDDLAAYAQAGHGWIAVHPRRDAKADRGGGAR